MTLNKRRILVCLLLIVAFLMISILMLSSMNLFSISKKSLNIESRKLSDMINTSSLTKFLSSSDKLKILDYFMEYERMKANLENLSFGELNRFMFLSDYLSKYFSVDDLGMSKELLDKTLEQFGKVSAKKESKNFLANVNIKDKASIKADIGNMRKEVLDLYDDNKISADTCEKIFSKLDDIEYKIDLSNIEGRDINLDLNDISNILDTEKSSFSVDADLAAFSDLDESLLDIQKSVDSIAYISGFLNDNISSINGEDVDISLDDYSFQIGNVLNNVDVGAFSNLLEFVGETKVSEQEAKPINFSKTMSIPKVSVEGTIEDAWNLNVKTSEGVNFSNILKPIDTSLISSEFLENQLDSIINVKVPDLDLTNLGGDKAENKPEKELDKIDESENKNNEGKKNNKGEKENSKKSSNKWEKRIFIKRVVWIIMLGSTGLIIFIISKRRRKVKPKLKEYSEDFISKKFRISDDMPKNYKQRLIEEGSNILDIVNRQCLKEDKMMTPREIMYGFLELYKDYNKDECDKFLKYFEESTFYNLEVDENIYMEFNNLCNKIFSLTKTKGDKSEKTLW